MAQEEGKESGQIFSTSAYLKVSTQGFVAQSSQESAGSKINKTQSFRGRQTHGKDYFKFVLDSSTGNYDFG